MRLFFYDNLGLFVGLRVAKHGLEDGQMIIILLANL